jgi:hypothetical protein
MKQLKMESLPCGKNGLCGVHHHTFHGMDGRANRHKENFITTYFNSLL